MSLLACPTRELLLRQRSAPPLTIFAFTRCPIPCLLRLLLLADLLRLLGLDPCCLRLLDPGSGGSLLLALLRGEHHLSDLVMVQNDTGLLAVRGNELDKFGLHTGKHAGRSGVVLENRDFQEM